MVSSIFPLSVSWHVSLCSLEISIGAMMMVNHRVRLVSPYILPSALPDWTWSWWWLSGGVVVSFNLLLSVLLSMFFFFFFLLTSEAAPEVRPYIFLMRVPR